MMMEQHILLITGSAEADAVIEPFAELVNRGQLLVTNWPGLSGRASRKPIDFPEILTPIDGVNALVVAVQSEGITAILDAGHGFEADTTQLAFHAARALKIPYMRLRRAPWDVGENTRWRAAATVADAVPLIPPGSRVFATTGWPSLPDYDGFGGEVLLLRQNHQIARDPVADYVEPVHGVPPFSKTSEIQLFEEMGVDLLIARNLGGDRSRPKLDAANALGLDVILIDPPALPKGAEAVQDVKGALDWLAKL